MSEKAILFLENRNLGYLPVGRFLRSLSHAYLVVIVPLYLAGLGYEAVPVGLLLSLTAVGTTAMGFLAGLLADRIGREAVLIGFAVLTTAGAVRVRLQSVGSDRVQHPRHHRLRGWGRQRPSTTCMPSCLPPWAR